MTTTTINLNDRGPIHGTPTFRVYTKSQWSDAVRAATDVLVEEVVWAVAPSISTATLHYRYGTVMIPIPVRASPSAGGQPRLVCADRDHWRRPRPADALVGIRRICGDDAAVSPNDPVVCK